MALLRVCRDAEHRAFGVVDPVGRKQAGEGRDEDAAAVVRDGLCELGDAVAVAEEAEVVHEELDAGAGDGDGALERVHGRDAEGGEVEGHGAHEAVRADHGLLAHVEEQEGAGAVGVLGAARGEASLANEGGGLVAEAAGDGGAGESGAGEFAVRFGVGGGNDLGEVDLGGLVVEVEEGEQRVVVFEFVDVHEHGPSGVGWVTDEDVGRRPAVEFVGEPGVYCAEAEVSFIVRFLDGVDVLHDPEEFSN